MSEKIIAHFSNFLRTVVASPLQYRNLSKTNYKFAVQLARINTGRCFRSTCCGSEVLDPSWLTSARIHVGCLSHVSQMLFLSEKMLTLKSTVDYERLPKDSRSEEHHKIGYGLYHAQQQRAAHAGSKLQMRDLLQRVLESTRNIQRVIITSRRRHSIADLQAVCRWKTCKIPKETHSFFLLSPLQTDHNYRKLDLTRIMSSITTSSMTTVKELLMEQLAANSNVEHMPMAVRTIQKLHQDVPHQTATFLANLTKLRLSLDTQSEPSSLDTRTIVSYLSEAQNLEYLSLRHVRYGRNPRLRAASVSLFHGTLSGCQFPKLRVTVLEGLDMEGGELLPFLRDNAALRHLVLGFLKLKGYLWKDLIEEIKATTKLESLQMDALYDGFTQEEFPLGDSHHAYVDYNSDVERYLLHDGPNPFSGATVAQARQDAMDPERQWLDPSPVRLYNALYFRGE